MHIKNRRHIFRSIGVSNHTIPELKENPKLNHEGFPPRHLGSAWLQIPQVFDGFPGENDIEYRVYLNVREYIPIEVDDIKLPGNKKGITAVQIKKVPAGPSEKAIYGVSFNIYLCSSMCLELEKKKGPFSFADYLSERTEIFATEFLCAWNTYLELREDIEECGSFCFSIGEVLSINHPDKRSVDSLLCSPYSIKSKLKAYNSNHDENEQVFTIKDLHSQLARGKHSPFYQHYMLGWTLKRRIKESTVVRKTRSFLLTHDKTDFC